MTDRYKLRRDWDREVVGYPDPAIEVLDERFRSAVIYRIDGITGEVSVASEDLRRPNGRCFSPDYERLYVVDTGCTDDAAFSRRLQLFDVAGGSLQGPRDFGDMAPGRGDGIRCDSGGNVWAAAAFGGEDENGVIIFAPDGMRIGHIHLPEPCSNLSFGGRRMNRVFITGGQPLYSLRRHIRRSLITTSLL